MKLTTNEDIILRACRKASKKNPLTNEAMQDLTGLTERGCRKVVESLRDKGERIINNGVGYWYATDKQFAEWLPMYIAGAKTIFKRVAAMNNHTEGQMNYFDDLTAGYIADLRDSLKEW